MKLILDQAAVRNPSSRADQWLLHPFSFTFRPGLYAVLGPNGGGKSTLLRMLAGIVAPSEGSVTLVDGGRELAFPALKRRIGYVPQETAVYEEMTAWAFLRYVATMKLIPAALIPDRIKDVASQFGLSEWLTCRVSSLSIGTKKLLAMAQSVLSDPDILLADEPLETLDPEALRRAADVLQGVARRSIVLLTTHRLDVLPGLADRILILFRGRLIGSHDPDDIPGRYDSFEHFYLDRIEAARSARESVF